MVIKEEISRVREASIQILAMFLYTHFITQIYKMLIVRVNKLDLYENHPGEDSLGITVMNFID